MEIPTTRELELEVLVRQQSKRIIDLQGQVEELQRRIEANEKLKSPLEESDVVTLPPNWVAYLTSRLNTGASTSSLSSPGSSAVTVALLHKVQSLQEENEELYEALNRNELGLLKGEVGNLKDTISKLETALKESHSVVDSLTAELEYYDSTLKDNPRFTRRAERPLELSRRTPPRSQAASLPNRQGPVPTGPRANKKPRMSEMSPPRSRDSKGAGFVSPTVSRVSNSPTSSRGGKAPSPSRKDRFYPPRHENHSPNTHRGDRRRYREGSVNPGHFSPRRTASPDRRSQRSQRSPRTPRTPRPRSRERGHSRERYQHNRTRDTERMRDRDDAGSRGRSHDRHRGDPAPKSNLGRDSRPREGSFYNINGSGGSKGGRGLAERMGL